MPNTYEHYPMVLNGVYIGLIGLRSDQKDYFNIPDPTPTEEAFLKYDGSIKAHTRNIHSEGLKSTTPTRVKSIGRVAVVKRERSKIVNSRGGRKITIPTELTSTPQQSSTAPGAAPKKPSIRFTVIKFPGSASNAEVSSWLHLKCTAHKPSYFKTEAGASRSVSNTGVVPTPAPTNP